MISSLPLVTGTVRTRAETGIASPAVKAPLFLLKRDIFTAGREIVYKCITFILYTFILNVFKERYLQPQCIYEKD